MAAPGPRSRRDHGPVCRMPIDPTIDHERRLVTARARGVLSDEELFEYQRTVWSRPDVAGYDELVDLSHVTGIDVSSSGRPRELARTAAGMDLPGRATRLAIVAPADYAFGLARMYATYRGLQEQGTKHAEVFRALPEALEWLARREA